MERFAFKIDAALKANLCKICRLCGIDNPGKVPILLPNEGDITDVDDPSLYQKVYELVGLTVTKNDKMPQTMCNLCVDKINDFYEFREMCYATNNQTRKLLGLKPAEPQKLVMDMKPIVKTETLTGAKRGRKRKSDEPALIDESLPENVKKEPMAWRKKLRLQHQQQLQLENRRPSEIKDEPADAEPTTTKMSLMKKGRKSVCSVCGDKFDSKELLDDHKNKVHVPWIPRYFCNACNQTHHNQGDIRAHQLWHKLSKAPYKCPLCESNVANAYAFARHLREHTPPTPIQLQVLDRECPLCKKTFVTNFFYNTHPCAIRKRKCGGCSRPLNTEAAYMRHAPTCSKIYLSHSKHILPEVVQTESQMRIKNEVEDELPLATIMPSFLQDEDMQPMVVLERLASPLLRASAVEENPLGEGTPSTSKSKSNERVSSKKYLKRVDQLLKNTMSTLVSIKHEPEVHINDTGPTLTETEVEHEHEDEPPSFSDFHDDNSDEEETAANGSSVNTLLNLDAVKQEPLEEHHEVQIKQEPLKLKLKITNNHGQLNSSIVDDHDEGQPRGSKKKKKRKHKERQRESLTTPSDENNQTTEASGVKIKEERVDNDYPDGDGIENGTELLAQATVMTSIPMTQLEGNYNDDLPHQHPDYAASTSSFEAMRDVKPNVLELDRLMNISHVASGVDMAEEAVETPHASDKHKEASPIERLPESIRPTKSTARKSTGGAAREAAYVPQIVAVKSGAAFIFNAVPDIAIKPEPTNRGYSDETEEVPMAALMEDDGTRTEEINHNEKIDEENAYINSLDFSNVTIKQEKDLDITDMTANGSQMECTDYNSQEEAGESEDDDDDSASSADEAEERTDDEEEEERIYQEIELQPLEQLESIETDQQPLIETEQQLPLEAKQRLPTEAKQQLAIEAKQQPVIEAEAEQEAAVEALTQKDVRLKDNLADPGFNIVITNVCSQIDESVPILPVAKPVTERSEKRDESSSNSADDQAKSMPFITLSVTKDNETEAQPIVEPTDTAINDTCDEEQQNVLNHEILEQQLPVVAVEEHLPVVVEEQPLIDADEQSHINPTSGPHEEVENRINELQQQEQLHGQIHVHQDQANDDSNINEIAENNNNANIERELQDDANVAQDNVNI